jgi:catechol 2,3-dioxygenase-like lactoylglutathione lyase family enzyme
MTTRARRGGTLIELHVPDLALATRFYGRFGFRVARHEPPNGDDGYLVLQLGDALLCFWGGTPAVRRHPYFRQFGRTSKRGYGVEIVVPVDDVEAAYQVARRARCVVEELQQRPWGARDFRIEDPFGYYVRITEPHDVLAERPRAARPPDGARPARARRRRSARSTE